MKEVITASAIVLSITGFCSEMDTTPPLPGPPLPFVNMGPFYNGPKDDIYYTGLHFHNFEHNFQISHSTLGLLARYSDVISVGSVNNLEDTQFTVTVDYAVAGCTNDAVVVVHDVPFGLIGKDGINVYRPKSNNWIVFAAYTNVFRHNMRMFWNSQEIPIQPRKIYSDYQMDFLNRSWWPVERDDVVLFTQFTNIIQAVRVDRNWTNYFELVRDGLTSTSDRVREDSFWDMGVLCFYGTHAQRAIILADPLVDPVFKNLINTPGWGDPNLEEPQP